MIGIFDSGVGGMTVARAIEQMCPGFSLVYFGDIARTPYGSKSPQTIERYAVRNAEFLLEQGARVLVIACNSAASVAADLVRRRFPVPVVDVIGPAVDEAVHRSRHGRIGIIGTRATISSGVYERAIRARMPEARVWGQACPLLVPLVEEGWRHRRETKMILRRYLHPLRLRQVDTLVLGCTHYPLLKHLIVPRIGRRVAVVDSSLATAVQVRRLLDTDPALAQRAAPGEESRFFVSDLTSAAQDLANEIFGRRVRLERTTAV